MINYLDFEKDIKIIDNKIESLKEENKPNQKGEIEKYNIQKKKLFEKIYSSLNSWQKVQVARHPERPHTIDYINNLISW